MPSVHKNIKANANTVWRWLSVPELMREWIPSVSEFRTADGAAMKKGSHLVFTARGRKRSSTVSEFVPMKLLTLSSVQGPFHADYHYRLLSGPGHCTVFLEINCNARGLARALAPLVRYAMWRVEKNQLDLLEQAIAGSYNASSG